MPEEILTALFPEMGSYDEKFAQLQAMGSRATTYLLIHGRVEDPEDDNQNHNIAYHPWVATWSGLRHSSPNVFMGIFGADGIEPANTADAIAFDALNSQNVNTHGGNDILDAMSPDNARFTITSDRELSIFWSVAMSPDRQHVIIVYHLLANTEQTENDIKEYISDYREFHDLLDHLDHLGNAKTGIYSDNDNYTLTKLYNTWRQRLP